MTHVKYCISKTCIGDVRLDIDQNWPKSGEIGFVMGGQMCMDMLTHGVNSFYDTLKWHSPWICVIVNREVTKSNERTEYSPKLQHFLN